jgi:hypothetical protein
MSFSGLQCQSNDAITCHLPGQQECAPIEKPVSIVLARHDREYIVLSSTVAWYNTCER